MKILQFWRFPTAIIACAMLFTPLVDIQLFGDYTVLTYIVESICAALGLLLLGVALYNAYEDSRQK